MFSVTIVCFSTTTLSLVLCANALLDSNKRGFLCLAVIVFALIAPGMVFTGKYLASTHWRVSAAPWISPCLLESDDKYMLGINGYLSFAREFVLFLPMAWAMYIRHGDYPSELLSVLRRDIGCYFLVIIVLGVLLAMFNTPGSPISDNYDIVIVMRMFLYPILANRILLNIRNTTDRRTRAAVISSLLFHVDDPPITYNDSLV
ncbi:hypothetical protein NMY22_g4828 [Coprinellus aureogranulatus]|nr:hypothetical protein NMY22_g4828 [Coprinellus aureogranulatus]